MKWLKIFLAILMVNLVQSKIAFHSSEFPVLHAIVNYFTGQNKKENKVKNAEPEILGPSIGQCNYDFYIQKRFKFECEKYDYSILHLTSARTMEVSATKPPLMVRCLTPVETPNSTFVENSLKIMNSVEEILEFLKPIGNATKRHEPGNCVVMLFYTPTSLGCAQIAPHINLLPKMFPTLRIGAIDAIRFPTFNAEFGIVGLPTVLIFHQGRPFVKFYTDIRSYSTFVSRHTGIKPIHPVPRASDLNGPLPLQPIQRTDYILIIAWTFIILCATLHFLRSKYFKKICDVIKSIWRESEAQLEQ